VELDLNTRPDLLILNGFSIPHADGKSFLSVFANQKPMKFEIFGKLPTTISTFAIMGISNIDQYWKDCSTFRAHHNISAVNTDTLDIMTDSLFLSIKSDFRNIFENECGVAFTSDIGDSGTIYSFSLIKVKSHDDAEKAIKSWIEKYSTSNNSNPAEFITTARIDEDISMDIYNFQFSNIPYKLFGNIFNSGTNQFCTLFDNYFIFGESPEIIHKFVNSIILNTTLSTDIEFSNISDYFSSQSNFIFYNKPSFSLNFYKHFLKNDFSENMQLHSKYMNNIQAIIYQFNTTNEGFVYNNLFVKYSPATMHLSPKAIWESQLDGKPLGKPQLMKNHLTNETEILIQDDKNNIYLLSKVGRILWKKEIDEPILSKIYQIDYYRNRKLQYFFNTRTKVYIIDRNGSYIEKFPVELKEPATNGIAVFDYEKNKEYRLYYAGEDRKIYTLDKYCKEVEGWKFKKTEGIVKQPLQHFRILGKDYIVFNDNYRIYIINRKGEERVKPEFNFNISENNTVNVLRNRKGEKYYFTITDTAGIIYFISTKGNITSVIPDKMASNHYFDVLDVNSDGVDDCIFTWGNNLKAYNLEGKEIMAIRTDDPVSFRPEFYEFSTNKYKIGLVTIESEKIYLYDCSGNLHAGFPLKGATQFSIGLLNNSENRFNLIVGSNKNLLYNYSVQ
jgi:hypothetical protein